MESDKPACGAVGPGGITCKRPPGHEFGHIATDPNNPECDVDYEEPAPEAQPALVCTGCGETVQQSDMAKDGQAGHIIPGAVPDLCGPVEAQPPQDAREVARKVCAVPIHDADGRVQVPVTNPVTGGGRYPWQPCKQCDRIARALADFRTDGAGHLAEQLTAALVRMNAAERERDEWRAVFLDCVAIEADKAEPWLLRKRWELGRVHLATAERELADLRERVRDAAAEWDRDSWDAAALRALLAPSEPTPEPQCALGGPLCDCEPTREDDHGK